MSVARSQRFPLTGVSWRPRRPTLFALLGPTARRFRGTVIHKTADVALDTNRPQGNPGLAEHGTHPALIAVLAITAPLFLSGRLDTILSTIGARL